MIPQKIMGINRVLYQINNDRNNNQELSEIVSDCHMDKDHISILRNIDDTINSSKILSNEMVNISQMPIILLPICTQNKPSGLSIAIRPVKTTDFMTALPYQFQDENILLALWKELEEKYADVLANFYVDLTGKPPATIEYE